MKGFTLLEILISILIFSFIVAGMYGVMNISKTNYDANSVFLDLQRQTRQGMGWLIRDIRGASLSSIVLEPDLNNSNMANITFNTSDEHSVRYYIDAATWQLKRKSSENPDPVTKANDITGLSFSNSSSIYKIELNASKTFFSSGQNRTILFPLSQQVQVRNT